MIRAGAATIALLLAAAAGAAERLGVVAIGDPPAGPDGDLAELAHQLRAACRDRVGGVDDVPTMRARLLGQGSNATASELDRAYGGALAVYQNGEFESAVRTLRAIIEDLEGLPETDEAYSQWIRAQLRLAHTALTISLEREADAAFFALARTDPSIQADPEQYSPSFRRRLDHVKAKVRALPSRRLVVAGEGPPGTVFVNGRRVGTTPLSMWLPAGKYRIGGAAGSLRVPSFWVDLESEDRSIVLDFALAESLRVNMGPGLALASARRGDGVVRAGAWLGVDRVIAVTRVLEGEAQFLLGSIYDVRRGALLREGSVRMVAGSVPSANLGALASFLLTGQSSRDVKDRTAAARAAPVASSAPGEAAPAAPPVPDARPPKPEPAPARESGVEIGETGAPAASAPATRKGRPSPAAAAATVAAAPGGVHEAATPSRPAGKPGAMPALGASPPETDRSPAPEVPEPLPPANGRRRSWMRPTAIAAGVLAGGLAGLSLQQALASGKAYDDARALSPDGVAFASLSDSARYDALIERGDTAKRNSYVSAGAAAALAAAAGVLGFMSRDRAPGGTIALRF